MTEGNYSSFFWVWGHLEDRDYADPRDRMDSDDYLKILAIPPNPDDSSEGRGRAHTPRVTPTGPRDALGCHGDERDICRLLFFLFWKGCVSKSIGN